VSDDRKNIYAALMTLALLFFYGAARAKPQVKTLNAQHDKAAKLEDTLESLSAQVAPRRTDTLRTQLDALKQTLNKDAQRLADAERRLASRAQAGELAVEVSALASELGLVVDGEEPEPARRAPTPKTLHAKLCADQTVRRWTLRGDYAGLWAFLNRLRTLSWQVVVLQLEVKRAQHLKSYEPPLQITMRVAL